MLAFGRETYLRLHPNPGFGIRLKGWRLAVSVHRGLEVFERKGTDWKLRWRRGNRCLTTKKWRT